MKAFVAGRRGIERSRGDNILRALCLAAGVLVAAVLVEIGYQVISGAAPAISKFGLGFLWHTDWAPNLNHFGAGVMLYGTAITSVIAMLVAVPLSIAIALYLAMLAPGPVRAVVGPAGGDAGGDPERDPRLLGPPLLRPVRPHHIEPFLYNTFGFIPIFGPPQTTGLSIFTAGLILTIMIVPIIASLSRDLFLTVPASSQRAPRRSARRAGR